MSNSVQTGVEEQMDQVVEVAKQLAPDVQRQAEVIMRQDIGLDVQEMAQAVKEIAGELRVRA